MCSAVHVSIVDVTRAKNAPSIVNIKKFPSSGALPVNDADGRFLVDPDLRSHAEERPDPKTNPEPKREVVRARARGGASCGRGGAERHQVIIENSFPAKKKGGRRSGRGKKT